MFIKPKIRPLWIQTRIQYKLVQLVKFINQVTDNLNTRNKTATTLLDIKKSFDKVWHEGLIYKFLAMEVLHQLV